MKEIHEISKTLPYIEGDKFEDFVEDIRLKGQLQPIVLYEGKILDGKNRYAACQRLGIPSKFVEYTGDDPVGHAYSLNIMQRELNAEMTAAYGVKILPLIEIEAKKRMEKGRTSATEQVCKNLHEAVVRGPQGKNPVNCTSEETNPPLTKCEKSRDKAAELTNGSGSSIQRAKLVLARAPEVFALMEQGKIPVKTATRLSKKPAEVRTDAVKRISSGERALDVVKEIEMNDSIEPVLESEIHEASDTADEDIVEIENDEQIDVLELAKSVMMEVIKEESIIFPKEETVRKQTYFSNDQPFLTENWNKSFAVCLPNIRAHHWVAKLKVELARDKCGIVESSQGGRVSDWGWPALKQADREWLGKNAKSICLGTNTSMMWFCYGNKDFQKRFETAFRKIGVIVRPIKGE
jgi:hypothetical protein